MRAVGFGDALDSYTETAGSKGDKKSSSRTTVTLSALPSDLSKVNKLPVELIQTVKSHRQEVELEIVALEGAPSVSAAIREMRVFHSVIEVRTGAETALTIVRNVLSDPKDLKMYRVKRSNPAFQRSLGRLKSSELLMHAIGFLGGQNIDHSELDATSTEQGSGEQKGEISNRSPSRSNAAYVLHSVSKGGFDPTASLSKGSGPCH